MGEVTRSCLINARDLGRGWKTTQRWYEPRWKVKRPLIDGGIEEDGAHCSTILLMGSTPDGVKTDSASHLLMHKDERSMVYVRTATAVFPAEENAKARASGYAAAIRTCRHEMRSVHTGFATPAELAKQLRISVERLRLPVAAFGLRTVTRWSPRDESYFDYRDVVIQRGRIVAGFSVHGLGAGPSSVDVNSLAILVADRLERAAARLRPSRVQIPVYVPDRVADSVARAALMRIGDYPARWRDQRFAEFGRDSSTSVYPGSLTLQLDELRPAPGMVGRAVATQHHVGWSHYFQENVAVYSSERRAKTAARAATERTFTRRRRRIPPGHSRITAGDVEELRFGRDVRALFRVKTWHMAADKRHPAIDVTSSDTVAVIRRGRMVATYGLAAKGVNVATAQALVLKVIRKLERAERRLRA
jgi:hypothetical protein